MILNFKEKKLWGSLMGVTGHRGGLATPRPADRPPPGLMGVANPPPSQMEVAEPTLYIFL
jgi:hypothetical protein